MCGSYVDGVKSGRRAGCVTIQEIRRPLTMAFFKKVFGGALLLAAASATAPGFAQSQALGPLAAGGECTLTVHVTGVRNHRGVVGGAVFASSAGWPEDETKAVAHAPFPIEGSTATLTFPHLAPGRYGVVVLHDENSNKKLDRNFLGIPKEGFGFGNNPRVLLSAPPFDRAAIDVRCPSTETEIALIYK